MNETVPPLPGSKPAPKTSALAIWSLVLGILSLTCLTIFSAIPGVICGHKALSRIKNSAGVLEGRGLAIAGLITGYIGIVTAIVILFVTLVAIPNFSQARLTAEKKTCIMNLRMLEGAKQDWALEHKKENSDIPTMQDLLPYLPGGTPHCPCGGAYSINAVGQTPTCSNPGHRLPDNEFQ